MAKYKNILKAYKESLDIIEKKVHNNNLTRVQNMQNAINEYTKILRKAEGDENVNKDEVSLAAIGLKAVIDDMNNQLTHYFIKDKSLIEFLKNTEIKDTSIVETYINENSSLLNLDSGYYTIAVHSETESYCFTYLQNIERTVVAVFYDDHATHFQLGSKVENPICKFAINFIYYLKAFPEKILEGVPQDMVKNDKKKFNSNNCHSVYIADEIVEKTEVIDGRTVIPHFRSGFFRHYKDDRYKNMKGKVQFIAATMVKGKAKTVVA